MFILKFVLSNNLQTVTVLHIFGADYHVYSSHYEDLFLRCPWKLGAQWFSWILEFVQWSLICILLWYLCNTIMDNVPFFHDYLLFLTILSLLYVKTLKKYPNRLSTFLSPIPHTGNVSVVDLISIDIVQEYQNIDLENKFCLSITSLQLSSVVNKIVITKLVPASLIIE